MFAPFDFGDLFQLFAPEIRVEEFVKDGEYVMRAELPGVDPDKDVEVTVVDGMLKVQVERADEKHEKVHSEFHYGRFVRTVALPLGAMEDTTTAVYANGILEITVKVGEPKEAGRHIAIETPKPKTIKAKAE
jgi:HSP20 family molecular chaperone IbpA